MSNYRWWCQLFFMFTPIWRRWTQFDEHIFQRGWFNHQLDVQCFAKLAIRMHEKMCDSFEHVLYLVNSSHRVFPLLRMREWPPNMPQTIRMVGIFWGNFCPVVLLLMVVQKFRRENHLGCNQKLDFIKKIGPHTGINTSQPQTGFRTSPDF